MHRRNATVSIDRHRVDRLLRRARSGIPQWTDNLPDTPSATDVCLVDPEPSRQRSLANVQDVESLTSIFTSNEINCFTPGRLFCATA